MHQFPSQYKIPCLRQKNLIFFLWQGYCRKIPRGNSYRVSSFEPVLEFFQRLLYKNLKWQRWQLFFKPALEFFQRLLQKNLKWQQLQRWRLFLSQVWSFSQVQIGPLNVKFRNPSVGCLSYHLRMKQKGNKTREVL